MKLLLPALLLMLPAQDADELEDLVKALAKNPDVETVESAHLAVTSGKSAAEYFAPRLEKVYALLASFLKVEPKGKLAVRICLSDESYDRNGGAKGTFSSWNPEEKHSVVLVDATYARDLSHGVVDAYLHALAPDRWKDVPLLLRASLKAYVGGYDLKAEPAKFVALQTERSFLLASRAKELAGRGKLTPIKKLAELKEPDLAAQEVPLWAVGYVLVNHKKTSEDLKTYLTAHAAGTAATCPVSPSLDIVVSGFFRDLSLKVPDREENGGWVGESRYYTIWVEKGTKRAKPAMDEKAILAELKDRMDLMYGRYAKAWKFDDLLPKRPRIYYYADEASYLRAGGPDGSLAYYLPSGQKLVAYEAPPVGKSTTFQTMCHEGCHQFFDLAFPGFYDKETNPTWFSEGLAECFGANEIRGKDLFIFTLGGPAADWTPIVQQYLEEGRTTSFKALFAMSHEEFMANANLHYGMSWSICHFLWCAPTPTAGEGGTYRDVIIKLIDGFKQGKDRDEVYKAAFTRGGKAIDLDALEKEWKEYVKKLKVK